MNVSSACQLQIAKNNDPTQLITVQDCDADIVNFRAVSSCKNLIHSETPTQIISGIAASSSKRMLHQSSYQGLRKSGVHVTEQEVKVNRRKILTKLNMLNNMSAIQFHDC